MNVKCCLSSSGGIMKSLFKGALLCAALGVFASCSSEIEEVNQTTDENEARAVQSWSLWDSLDYYNTGAFNKAEWSNGGMFNCGWKADHVYFNNGKMTIKLDNTASHGKQYSSGEYRTNNTFSYGTFETNMIAAKGDGLVTSFFLYTGNPWDEIDVEVLGKDTTKVQFNYYVDGVANNENTDTQSNTETATSTGTLTENGVTA